MRYFFPFLLLIGLATGPGGSLRAFAQVAPEATEKSTESKDGPRSRGRFKYQQEEKASDKPAEKGGANSSTDSPPAPQGDVKLDEPTAIKQRPLLPADPPNPDELKARLTDDGKIRFNFRGQPWEDVLTWLAEVSEMSFDWQELPGDYLNLVTQRGYSIEEARDLINRHLLARGYTMLESDELLTVVNVKKLDAGMVPRVEPKDLAKRRPHEFVKVSFPLEWIVAESAVDELKPMLSPNGKLASLKSTNRLEAMDAVINLREIYKVIGQEQSDIGQEKLVREFDLQHSKAEEVYQQLQKLLGMEERPAAPTTGRAANGAQVQQMLQQQQQEMMQQLQRNKGMPTTSPQKPDINLVVNARRNSILARANPDKMAVIGQAIKMLDVPSDQSQTMQGSLGRMQVYRLSGLEPNSLVKTLEESGGLDPTTRLQVDEKNKAIIAHASMADHMMIRKAIDKLDGSGRKFEVVTLRKLGAEYVAGSIEFMFNGGTEEKGGRRQEESRRNGQDVQSDKFRVDADTENNRLLLWANEIELQEIRNLLVKLGEMPDPRQGRNLSRVRVLTIAPQQAEEWLDRLRRTWPTVAPNPLIIPEQKPTTEPVEAPTAPTDAPAANQKSTNSQSTQNGPNQQPWQAYIRLAQLKGGQKPERVAEEDIASPNDKRPAGAPKPSEPVKPTVAPPVKVEVGSDGRLIVSSQDTEALDRMEELADELAPERREYQVFKLKHAPAYWVRLNLVEFFDEEDKSKKNETGRRNYYYFEPPAEKKDPRQRLSKRKTLKFIADAETNTILVLGADLTQLRTIEELIELYDRPEPANSKSARMTTVVAIRYSQAKTVADAVKEVYRDLLSANDKALAPAPGTQQRPQLASSYIGGDESDKRSHVTFKGKLSIGIDEISNTLLVSADGENLLNNVLKMIESLDKAAQPNSTVHVVKLGGGVNTFEMKRVLTGLLAEQGTQGSTSRPSAPAPQAGGGQRNQRGGR